MPPWASPLFYYLLASIFAGGVCVCVGGGEIFALNIYSINTVLYR